MKRENVNNFVIENLNKIFRIFYPAQTPESIRKEYGIPEKLDVKIEITPDGYFVLSSETLPGFITEANNGKELMRMVNDAILTYYDVPKRAGDIVHDELNIHGYGTLKINSNKVMQKACN